jgi:hypothetical protein
MQRGNFLIRLAIFAGCAAMALSVGARAGTPRKIDLRVLYAGHPGSVREQDFFAFLSQHFSRVGPSDFAEFTLNSADGYDVVVMDYDGEGVGAFKTQLPTLAQTYSRPTVNLGIAGGMICGKLALKSRHRAVAARGNGVARMLYPRPARSPRGSSRRTERAVESVTRF